MIKGFFSFFPLIYFYYPNKNRNKKNSTQTHMYLIFLYKSFRWKEGKKVLIVGDCISDIELFNISLLFSIIFLCSLLLTGRKNFFFATQQNKKLKLRSKSFWFIFGFSLHEKCIRICLTLIELIKRRQLLNTSMIGI